MPSFCVLGFDRRRVEQAPLEQETLAQRICSCVFTASFTAMVASMDSRQLGPCGPWLLPSFLGGHHASTSPERSASSAVMKRPSGLHVHRLGLAHEGVRRCVPPITATTPEVDLGLPELGGVAGDDEIAHPWPARHPPSQRHSPPTAADDRLADTRQPSSRPRRRTCPRPKTSTSLSHSFSLSGPAAKALSLPVSTMQRTLFVLVGRFQRLQPTRPAKLTVSGHSSHRGASA